MAEIFQGNKQDQNNENVQSIPCIKISVLGSMFTGKTSLITQFVNNRFEEQYEDTKDTRNYRKICDITENPEEEESLFAMIEIQDIFGINHPNRTQEAFKEKLTQVLENSKIYVENAGNIIYQERSTMGFMFVMDLTDTATLQDLIPIMEYIRETEQVQARGHPTKKMLVSNKLDKEPGGIDQDEISQLCEMYNMKYIAVSALENLNVDLAFLRLARDVMTDVVLWKFEDFEKQNIKLADRFIQEKMQEENIRNQENIIDRLLNIITCGKSRQAFKQQQRNANDSDDDEGDMSYSKDMTINTDNSIFNNSKLKPGEQRGNNNAADVIHNNKNQANCQIY